MKLFYISMLLFSLPTILFCMQQAQQPPQIPLIKIQLADQLIEIPKNIAQMSGFIKRALDFNEKNNIERPIDMTNFDKEQFDIILQLLQFTAHNQIVQLHKYLKNWSIVDLLNLIYTADFLAIPSLIQDANHQLIQKSNTTHFVQDLSEAIKNNINIEMLPLSVRDTIQPMLKNNAFLWLTTSYYAFISQNNFVKNLKDTDNITNAFFTTYGNILFTKSNNNVKRWDTKTGNLISTFAINPQATASDLSHDGSVVVCEHNADSHSTSITVFSTNDGKQLDKFTYNDTDEFIEFITTDPINRWFALQKAKPRSLAKTLSLISYPFTQITQKVQSIDLLRKSIIKSFFSPAGKYLACVVQERVNNYLYLYNLASNNLQDIKNSVLSASQFASFTFDSRDSKLAIGEQISQTNPIKIYSLPDFNFTAHRMPYKKSSFLTFNDSSSWLSVGYVDGSIQLFDVNNFSVIANFAGHNNPITSLTFSPDGSLLAEGSQDTTMNLWNINSRGLITHMTPHHSAIKTIKFNAQGNQFAVIFADKPFIQLYFIPPEIEQLNLNQLLLLHTIFNAKKINQKMTFFIGVHNLAIETYKSLPLALQNFAKQFLIIRKPFPEELESRKQKLERLEKEIEGSKK